MYISKFWAEHFQIHENASFEFKDGVNVIIGESDHGKSSIYRGLKALFLNNIKLDRKITHDVKNPKCVLRVLGEFGELQRTKSKSKNLYHIDEKELKAFGQGTVSDVVDFTNISDINFQSQHDQPFLISASSGEVAKYLNKIIDLEVIDITLSNLKSAETDATRKSKSYEELYKEKQEELKVFEGVEECLEVITDIEDVQKEIAENDEEIVKLDELLEKLDGALTICEVFEDADFGRISKVENALDKLNSLDADIEILEDTLSDLARCEDKEIRKLDISKVVKAVAEYDKITNELIDLLVLTDKLEEIMEEPDYDLELEQLEAELKEISGVCPTCGKKL